MKPWHHFFKSIKIIAGPAVFECGDSYAVVWATSAKGSGYVLIDGIKYWDMHGGVIKTHDCVHTVRISKEKIIGHKYKVVSQRINFKDAYSAAKGKTVESAWIDFGGAAPSDDINILSVSDVHDMAEQMYEAVKHINTRPDYIVMLGDISSVMIEKKRYICGILEHAGNLSGGMIPVAYIRGNHETRGEFASQMINYLPTSTGEFYYTFDFGLLSAVVIDSGEDKTDDHEEYSGLVDFSDYREQEYNWLCSLKEEDFKGKYLIAFSHAPKLENHFGKNWVEPLKNLGMQLIVGGHHHTSEFINSAPPVYVECGKLGKTGKFGAALITLHENTIKLKTVTNNGEIILDEEVII